MLGLASYQDALRALGRLFEPATELRLVEDVDHATVEVTTGGSSRRFSPADLEEVIVDSHARRGEHQPAGALSDILRSVGLALDELHAVGVWLALSEHRLNVRFSDRHARSHELSYAGDELDELRLAAAARRHGQPLRRVVVLEASPASAASILELLVAEFAVQTLPAPYARAVAAASEPPDLVLAQASSMTVEALRTLRSGRRTAEVPIVVLAGPETQVNPDQLFSAGADDLLQEPVQPAQLRARVRTWLLRRRVDLDVDLDLDLHKT